MQQIQAVWSALSTRRRFVVALATLAMFAAVLGLARMATTPGMALLYAGLESGPAGEVVRALEARGVPYEVRGGTIFVSEQQRDELRMTLASEGLPANSAQGYELLDTLSGFGTTSQMFDAAYWRAKEGELARTLLAVPGIATARVHIANIGSNPFQREIRPTASVAITTRGTPLPVGQARAIKYLVASAVAGMSPEDVAVIDGDGALIAPAEERAPPEALGEERAAVLRDRVQRLLEARVGRGNAVVEVAVETDTDAEVIRERVFDPDRRVAISTDTEERTGRSQDSGGGVTVASNLPDGDAAAGDESSSQESETRERVNYEVSETQREVTRAPGAIRRISVAVLVNGVAAPGPDGQEVLAPRPDEELEALRALVASAVGFDETRGDEITLRSMAFEASALPLPAPAPGVFDRLHLDIMSIIQLAVLALVALLLGVFVVRPILRGATGNAALAVPAPAPAPANLTWQDQAASSIAPAPPGGALTGELGEGELDLPVISEPGAATVALEQDPVERLRALIGERREETVEILRTWLDDRQEKA